MAAGRTDCLGWADDAAGHQRYAHGVPPEPRRADLSPHGRGAYGDEGGRLDRWRTLRFPCSQWRDSVRRLSPQLYESDCGPVFAVGAVAGAQDETGNRDGVPSPEPWNDSRNACRPTR